jgi:hypothetical protein
MRIFIQDHNTSPEELVRQALDVLIKAGIYFTNGGGIINDRAIILIAATHAPEAVAALSRAGMRALIG